MKNIRHRQPCTLIQMFPQRDEQIPKVLEPSDHRLSYQNSSPCLTRCQVPFQDAVPKEGSKNPAASPSSCLQESPMNNASRGVSAVALEPERRAQRYAVPAQQPPEDSALPVVHRAACKPSTSMANGRRIPGIDRQSPQASWVGAVSRGWRARGRPRIPTLSPSEGSSSIRLLFVV